MSQQTPNEGPGIPMPPTPEGGPPPQRPAQPPAPQAPAGSPRRPVMWNVCWVVLVMALVAVAAMHSSWRILEEAFLLLAAPNADVRVEGMAKMLQAGGIVAFAGTVETALAMIGMRVIERA